MSGIRKRRQPPIVVVVVPAEAIRAAASLSTADLLAMAADGNIVARAALVRYRRYQWRGVVN